MCFCLLLLTAMLAIAQAPVAIPPDNPGIPPTDWLKFDGHQIHDIHPADSAVLNFLVRQRLTKIQQEKLGTPQLRRLGEATLQLAASGEMAGSWRLGNRFLLLSSGIPLFGPAEALPWLNFFVDHRYAEPGDIIHASIEPGVVPAQDFDPPVQINIDVLDAKRDTAWKGRTFEFVRTEKPEASINTANWPPGDYRVRYRLFSEEDKPLVTVTRPLTLHPTLKTDIVKLQERFDKLRIVSDRPATVSGQMAFETTEYLLQEFRNGLRENTASLANRIHPALMLHLQPGKPPLASDALSLNRDLSLLKTLLDNLEQKKDPFAGLSGDLHLAWRSPQDKTLQPFRLFVPAAPQPPDPTKRQVLLALHGLGSNENTLFDDVAPLRDLIEKRSWLTLVPEARGPFTAYDAKTMAEVLALVETVPQIWSAALDGIYVLGHSPGARAALTAAFKDPKSFRAAAAVASLLPTQPGLSLSANLPIFIASGGRDTILLATAVRTSVLGNKSTLRGLQHVEFPAEDHFSVLPAALPQIFDFFDAVRAGTWTVPAPAPVRR